MNRSGHDPREVDAMLFAAHLLMPAFLLKKEIGNMRRNGGPLTDRDVENLAKKFQVPEVQMTAQLVRLHLL